MKIKLHRLAIAAAALIAVAAYPSPIPSAPPFQQPLPAKVTSRAWSATDNGRSADVIVAVAGYPDLSAARALTTKEAKTRYVAETLLRHAQRTQAALRSELDARKTRYQVLWISNSLFVPSADRATLQWLGARADVARVDLDIHMRGVQDAPSSLGAIQPAIFNPQSALRNPQSIEWGVLQVRAPEVWALGITGQGIVVADLDTGVQWDHPALKGKYRGWNGTSADHNFNWFDGTGEYPTTPTDANSHGTHTVGTILGDDGAGNQLGVAPGAQWIGCRNMAGGAGIGSVARYTVCFQFALAPTDLNGNNPDPARSADITSNSWTCDPGFGEEGCDVPSALVTVTQVLRDAGILTVAAAGNSIPGCSGISQAPGTLDQVFTVGATDSANNIASFSNRGPSSFTGHLKPDLAAPGVSVRSSIPTNNYSSKSGTSMATPHVAGVVALLWSAAPWLRGQIDETEAILRQTARPLTTGETCGGLPAGAAPNNTYGHGLIDARAAISEAQAVTMTGSAPALSLVTEPITYVIQFTNQTNLTRTHVVLTAVLPISTMLAAASGSPIVANGVVTWPAVDLSSNATLTHTLAISAQQPNLITLASYGLSYDGLSIQRGVQGPPVTTLAYGHRHRLVLVYR